MTYLVPLLGYGPVLSHQPQSRISPTRFLVNNVDCNMKVNQTTRLISLSPLHPLRTVCYLVPPSGRLLRYSFFWVDVASFMVLLIDLPTCSENSVGLWSSWRGVASLLALVGNHLSCASHIFVSLQVALAQTSWLAPLRSLVNKESMTLHGKNLALPLCSFGCRGYWAGLWVGVQSMSVRIAQLSSPYRVNTLIKKISQLDYP